MTISQYNYRPRKVVRSFRDLEVYQTTLGASVVVVKDIKPKLAKLRYSMVAGLTDCAMTIPLLISEAHSIRFGDHKQGLLLLERAMAGCNKMVVYLEQAKGVYGAKVDGELIDDLVGRYANVRTKISHLEKSWQKWTPPSRS